MEKHSKSTDIGPIVINFAVTTWLIHTNLHAKNQENPPRGYRDRPMATDEVAHAHIPEPRVVCWRPYLAGTRQYY